MRLRVYLNRCVRSWDKFSECRVCVDACRFRAIELKDRRIVLKESNCVGCGECVASCPLYVFDSGVEDFIETIKSYRKRNLVISCRDLSTNHKDYDMLKICVNHVRLEQYLILIDLYEKILIDARCEKCPLKGSGVSRVERLEELIRETALRNKITILKGEADTAFIKREMIRDLVRESVELFIELHGLSLRDLFREKPLSNTNKFTPASRVLLPEVIRRRSIVFQIKSIDIDIDKCNLCGVCENVCPTNAIVVREDLGLVIVDHSKCLGCLGCVDMCPFKAVQVRFSPINEIQSKIIDLKRCSFCGKKYNAKYDECPYCSHLRRDIERLYTLYKHHV
ncbi:MAG: 4Fe-4S dicluster domain-containing protein [Sulfolobales archaeon]